MQVACYVWTDAQIINACNARRALYPKDQVVLFVLMLERVSRVLLDEVARSGVFTEVVRVAPPPDHKDKHVLWRRARLLTSGGAYRRYFSQIVCGRRFEILVVSGYWSYALFLLQAVYRYNPSVRVILLEEGVGSYYRTLARTCQIWPRTCREEYLTRLVYFGGFAKKARALAEAIMLYQPQCSRVEGVKPVRLPSIKDDPKIMELLRFIWSDDDVSRGYLNAKGYFFPLAYFSERVTEIEAAQWEGVKTCYPLALRCAHPEEPGALPVLFEAVCAHTDISGRILIGFSSSCMVNPKYWFDQEPYVIFMHRMDGAYNDTGLSITEADAYAADLSICYRDPKRVLIPESMDELKIMLEQVQKERGMTL